MTTSPAAATTRDVAFKGWSMVLWCTIVRGVTAPGQTIGVSAFIDPMKDSLGLSRSAIATAYLIGTLAGAFALPRIGRWVDRVGISHSMTIVGTLFACVVALTGSVQGIVMLTLAFVGLRTLGQGSLTLIAATGVVLWFDRRRGFALAISAAVGISMLSFAPLLFSSLIDGVGWRWAWVILGFGVAMVVLPIAKFAIIDRPEDIGQVPDGVTPPGTADSSVRRSYNLAQALRTPAFWTLGALTALMSGLITGLTFHNTDIMGSQGLTESEAAAVFIPQMVGSVTSGLTVGWLADRIAPRILMTFGGMAAVAGVILATTASPGTAAMVYGFVSGLAIGSISALGGALYPRWYGTAHVGAIKGAALSIGVASSALGPLVLAVGNDLADSYEPVLMWSAVVSLVVTVLALLGPMPASEPPGTR
ncbi:MAG: MFS transporter [Acidimicrobiales bacterium]